MRWPNSLSELSLLEHAINTVYLPLPVANIVAPVESCLLYAVNNMTDKMVCVGSVVHEATDSCQNALRTRGADTVGKHVQLQILIVEILP
jgi:hypothetical protein